MCALCVKNVKFIVDTHHRAKGILSCIHGYRAGAFNSAFHDTLSATVRVLIRMAHIYSVQELAQVRVYSL